MITPLRTKLIPLPSLTASVLHSVMRLRVRLGSQGGAVDRNPVGELHWGPDELLSVREAEILGRIITGISNGEIAGRLGVNASMVKTYVNHILRKLGVLARTQAAARRRELGLG